jgi:TP901 family phage tail tape measure protein
MGGFENETERVRSRMDVLNRLVTTQAEKVRQLRQSYDQSVQATGEDSRATQLYAAQVNRAVTELNRLQGELTQTTEQFRRLESNSNSFSRTFEGMSNRLQNVGMGLSMVFGSMALTIGGALKNAISSGAEFESEMAKVGAKAGASADEMQQLSEKAQELAPLAGGAKNAATAMDDLAAKGYSVNQIMEAMPGILNAANASGEDLALTSDTITSALEAFHMKATDTSHVADVLAQTANMTAAGMTDLQYTFKYAAPIASQLGISMEQLASMTGLMAQSGIKGEQAGTSLREAMLRLADPPKEAANQLHNLGVKVTDNQGKFRSFSDIIGDLNNSTAKMTDAQKAAALSQIFGTNAVSGMMAVISSGKGKIDDLTNSLIHSDGASKKAADAMQNNFAGSMRKLTGAIDAAKIGIEQALAPALRSIADKVQSVVTSFNKLSPEMKSFIAVSAGITAAIATIGSSAGLLMMGLGGLGLSFGALTGPIGLAVAAIGIGTIAAIGIKKAMDASKQANLDHAQSLVDQQNAIKDLSTQYQALRDKNKLSNDEILRFRDIQNELKTAKSADEIAKLKDEADKLQQKSGLTNDEFTTMLGLNDQIIQKTPDVKQSFSDRGTAIISNKDALDQVNTRLAENTRLELENQRIKAEANLTQEIQNYIKALDELKTKEKERDTAAKERDTTEQRLIQLKTQAQQQLNQGKDQEAQKTIDEIANTQILLGHENSKVISLANEVTQKQNSVNKTQEEIAKTQQLYDKMVNLELAQVGINATGAEGLSQLDQAIQKTQARINELNAAKQSQGGLNAEQQNELTNLQQALGQYQNTKNEIGKIQGEQQSVNTKIDQGTGKARDMNKELGMRAVKDVTVDDHGQADSLNEKVSKEVTKKVTLQAILSGLSSGMQAAFRAAGFAKGTDNAPGGWSWVGEQGPELMYVPKGSKIIPNNKVNSAMNNNPTGQNSNGNKFDVKIYPQSVSMDEYQLARTLQRLEALYG